MSVYELEGQPGSNVNSHKQSRDPDEPDLPSKLVMEFLGTFFLTLTVSMVTCGSLNDPQDEFTCVPKELGGIAVAFVLMGFIFMGGHISGGHFNPAVSIGVLLRGQLPVTHCILYVLTQVVAALPAVACQHYITDGLIMLPPMQNTRSIGVLFLSEFLFSFALVTVVLNVATTQSNKDNSFYGLAIGTTVGSGAVSFGAISGGIFNPAVASGMMLNTAFHGHDVSKLWIYWMAPVTAAIFSALVFRLTNRREFPTSVLGFRSPSYVRFD